MKSGILKQLVTFFVMSAGTVTAYSAIEADANPVVVKSCLIKTSLDKTQPPIALKLTVYSKGSSIGGLVSEWTNGVRKSRLARVEALQFKIRTDLVKVTNLEDKSLNPGELLLLQALYLTADPDLKGKLSTGVDIGKVRMINTYYFDRNPKDMGSAALIEAYDETGSYLGSFVGGFLVLPCM